MRRSILLAEDQERVRDVMRRALERSGYDVCEAVNGDEAMRALRAVPFDLVITDLLMPEKDGLETIAYVREQSPGSKIIAITGAEDKALLSQATGLGATRVLAKPFKPSELLNLVSELLEPRPEP